MRRIKDGGTFQIPFSELPKTTEVKTPEEEKSTQGYEALRKFFSGKTMAINFGSDDKDYLPNDCHLIETNHALTTNPDGPTIIVLKSTKQRAGRICYAPQTIGETTLEIIKNLTVTEAIKIWNGEKVNFPSDNPDTDATIGEPPPEALDWEPDEGIF